MSRWMILLVGLACCVGCGPKIERMPEAMSISGKLTVAGAPVGGVVLNLQPTQSGHPVVMQVGPDGSFSGSAVPGKYAYYATAAEDNPGALERVPDKYRTGDLSRTVTIAAGQSTMDIKLD